MPHDPDTSGVNGHAPIRPGEWAGPFVGPWPRTVRMSMRRRLGEALFETSGDHHLVLLLVPGTESGVADLAIESTAHARSTRQVRASTATV
jgi:hypothetical protein